MSHRKIKGGAAAALSIGLIEETIKEGGVFRIPSRGVIVTSARLEDKTGAVSPSQEEVEEALQQCLWAQEKELEQTKDASKKQAISQTIARLQADLANPSKYLW